MPSPKDRRDSARARVGFVVDVELLASEVTSFLGEASGFRGEGDVGGLPKDMRAFGVVGGDGNASRTLGDRGGGGVSREFRKEYDVTRVVLAGVCQRMTNPAFCAGSRDASWRGDRIYAPGFMLNQT